MARHFPFSPRSAFALIALLSPFAVRGAVEPFDEGRLEREVLVTGLRDSVQLQVAPNGDVYFIERAGALRRYTASDRAVRTLGTLPIAPIAESHLTGLALDPSFARTGLVYIYYSPKEPGNVMRLSRFVIRTDALELTSEKVLLTIPFMPLGHSGGGMQFDADGNLWLSVGDNAAANVTPETDERPGRENYNALGTSANSQDLRGKILRLRPHPDGTYTIPTGNLFNDARQGRPEIYVMGCRNPYRFHFDSPGRTLYWAEVGSNTEERFGTGGYDEISRTTGPGNSGWPLFIGPNTPYRHYDHATNTVGDFHSVDRPRNDSRLNTGLRDLPPPIPALIWYGSEDSQEFPALGNGGRSAMVAFYYRHDAALASDIALPAHFDQRLFIYDWCRNWIKTVTFDAQGGVAAIQPFFAGALLRRPIDLKLGPDGAIYLIEFGEKWAGNTDGTLSRIVYRRGNRAPVARATADTPAGRAPLTVRFSAAGSTDADGDTLTYQWTFGEDGASATGRDVSWTYQNHGVRQARVLVTDAHGAAHSTALSIAVGNAPPEVRITQPAHGGFFDWGKPLPFAIAVEDPEDGSTRAGTISAEKVATRWTYRDQPSTAASESPQIGFDGAAAVMRRSDCLSCHQLAATSIGPSFLAVADRYRDDPKAPGRLGEKILQGGAGAWGDVPMPPHPQHNGAEIAAMAAYILDQRAPDTGEAISGLQGTLPVPPRNQAAGGSYILTASYRDHGAAGVPPLTTEARVVLHARRKRAMLFDAASGATTMEVSTLRRSRRIPAQLVAGGYLLFRDVALAGIARLACEVSAGPGHGGVLEFRVDRPDGPLVGSVAVPETGQWDNWRTVSASITDPGGVRDFYVVARQTPELAEKRLNLDTLEFVPAPADRVIPSAEP